ncbi:MAG: metal ABC transporter substrate-binding protein [Lachnospiraceae bacterium]|nr:metal ABC transporter substrate-binding protein [Lachnospiraceae bacterium]
MKNKKTLLVVIMLVAILAIAGIVIAVISVNNNNKSTAENDGKFTVVTSFYPMYIATMNVVDSANVNLVNLSEPKTGCLHDYQLTTDDMKLLSTADVFVINGGGMEEFLEDVVERYPNLKVVDASKGIEIEEGNAHIWMSVNNYIKQVENIAKGLSEKDGANSKTYTDNAAKYIEKLKGLSEQVDESMKGKKVMLLSEAYEYLAKDFGMEVVGVLDLDEEKDVSANELAETIDKIKNNGVGLILAEKEHGEKMAESIMQQVDVKTLYLDTIVSGEYDKDAYLNRMNSNITMLKGSV